MSRKGLGVRYRIDQEATCVCQSCGEIIDVFVDPSAGQEQEYVEECGACCRPNVIQVQFDPKGRAVVRSFSE